MIPNTPQTSPSNIYQTAESVENTLAGERANFTVTVPRTGDEEMDLISLVLTFVSQSYLGHHPERVRALLCYLEARFRDVESQIQIPKGPEISPTKEFPPIPPAWGGTPLGPTTGGTAKAPDTWMGQTLVGSAGNPGAPMVASSLSQREAEDKLRSEILKRMASKLGDATIK